MEHSIILNQIVNLKGKFNRCTTLSFAFLITTPVYEILSNERLGNGILMMVEDANTLKYFCNS